MKCMKENTDKCGPFKTEVDLKYKGHFCKVHSVCPKANKGTSNFFTDLVF